MTDGDINLGQAAAPGTAAWYALLFTPPERRDAVSAVLELRAEILASARRPSEPSVALARLQWWRAELGGFGSGREQHPLTRLLRGVDGAGALQPEYLLEMVDAAESELSDPPCRNYAELALYCYRSGGVCQEIIAGLQGIADPANERAVQRYARRLGHGVRLVELLGDLPADLAAGRRLLPRDWILETGSNETIGAAGEMDLALRTCLDRLAGDARSALDEAESLLPPEERPRQRAGVVLAALCRRQLDVLHASGFRPGKKPGNLANLWTAWRAARRATRAVAGRRARKPA